VSPLLRKRLKEERGSSRGGEVPSSEGICKKSRPREKGKKYIGERSHYPMGSSGEKRDRRRQGKKKTAKEGGSEGRDRLAVAGKEKEEGLYSPGEKDPGRKKVHPQKKPLLKDRKGKRHPEEKRELRKGEKRRRRNVVRMRKKRKLRRDDQRSR